MQRINSVKNPNEQAKSMLEQVHQKLGTVPNMFTVFANSPATLEGYLNFSDALVRGVLDAKLKEKIAIAVAGFNGCDYCASAHTFLGSKVGINADELQENLAGRSSDSKTHAALKFARALMDRRGRVSDDDLHSIRAAGFSDEEIIEILAHVALNTFTNYFNETALTEIDFPHIPANNVRRVA